MSGWWVADTLEHGGVVLLFSWAFWVISSIVLHELGHGVAAIRCGDRTPIESGHMTLNPLVHMGKWSLIAFAVIGIAWGAMPVNPARFRRGSDDALVAAAGPAVNLVLFAICVVLTVLTLILAPEKTANSMANIFFMGARLNIVLLVFNLLPIPPLDGSRILATYSHGYRRMLMNPQAGSWIMGAFFLIFFFGGQYLWPFADHISASAVGLLHSLFS